jgi:Malectin domain
MPLTPCNIHKQALPIDGNRHCSCFVDVEIQDDTETTHDDFLLGRDPKQTTCGCYKFSCVTGWILTAVLMAILVVLVQQHLVRTRSETLSIQNGTNSSSNHGGIYEVLVTEAPMPFVVRINCGATGRYMDEKDREWIPDTAPGISNVYSILDEGEVVSLTSDDPLQPEPHMENVGVEGVGLYVDERIFKTVGRYEIAVPSIGWYYVDLFFAETFYALDGQRVFDVLVENIILVEENLDIVKRAGANLTATVATHAVLVPDFSLSLILVPKIEYAKLSGIRVRNVPQ